MNRMTNHRTWIYLCGAMMLALVLRLINISAEPLWGDELLSLDIVLHFHTVRELFQYLSWVEVHPRLAHDLRLDDGSEVFVVSPKGKVRARLRVVPGKLDDVVAMPLFVGHASEERWTRRGGGDPTSLVVDVEDSLKGIGVPSATRVRIERV